MHIYLFHQLFQIGREMESFDVGETSGEALFNKFKNVTIIPAYCTHLNAKQKVHKLLFTLFYIFSMFAVNSLIDCTPEIRWLYQKMADVFITTDYALLLVGCQKYILLYLRNNFVFPLNFNKNLLHICS